MASVWPEEETFTCSVCLETLRDPATLPCGHSYCLTCIQNHWDKRDSQGQYSCPQCRQVFNPRPSLARSTLLVEAMEKLRNNSLKQRESSSAPPSLPIYVDVLPEVGPQPGCIYPQLPVTVAPRMCPQHNQPLDLFCQEDKECVCALCRQYGHIGHNVVKPAEERRHKQEELVQMQLEVKRRVQLTERTLKEIPHGTLQQKALIQAVQTESADLFSDLIKTVNVTGNQIREVLDTHEASLSSQVEGKIQKLEQEVAQLHWRNEELSRLADMQDNICFLKNFFLLEPLGRTDAGPSLGQEAVVASFRSALKDLHVSIENECKASIAKIHALVNAAPTADANHEPAPTHNDSSPPTRIQSTVYETVIPGPVTSVVPEVVVEASAPPPPPPRPYVVPVAAARPVNYEPKTRDEMIKYRFVPTLDPHTAYRHVQLSDGGRKATLKAENMNYPEHPERFHFWRQVLCREPLGGSPYYWEVEWTGTKVTIGVSYKEIDRKSSDDTSRLGHNLHSWSLYWSGTGFSFWHNNQEKLLGSPKSHRVGVYLDQHSGVLAFYRVNNNQSSLIHKHKVDFTGPLYPGFRFWAGVGSTITICDLD